MVSVRYNLFKKVVITQKASVYPKKGIKIKAHLEFIQEPRIIFYCICCNFLWVAKNI